MHGIKGHVHRIHRCPLYSNTGKTLGLKIALWSNILDITLGLSKSLLRTVTYLFMCVSSNLQRNIRRSNQHILPSLISVIGCLARDDIICTNMAHYPEYWEASLVAMVNLITDLFSCQGDILADTVYI